MLLLPDLDALRAGLEWISTAARACCCARGCVRRRRCRQLAGIASRGQAFENGAIHGRTASAGRVAAPDESRHAEFERLQLGQLVPHVSQVLGGNLAHFNTGSVGLVNQSHQLTNLLDGEAEVPAAPNEAEASNSRSAVSPAPTLGTWHHRQQPNFFVVANRRHGAAGLTGQQADGDGCRGVHALQLSLCGKRNRAAPPPGCVPARTAKPAMCAAAWLLRPLDDPFHLVSRRMPASRGPMSDGPRKQTIRACSAVDM